MLHCFCDPWVFVQHFVPKDILATTQPSSFPIQLYLHYTSYTSQVKLINWDNFPNTPSQKMLFSPSVGCWNDFSSQRNWLHFSAQWGLCSPALAQHHNPSVGFYRLQQPSARSLSVVCFPQSSLIQLFVIISVLACLKGFHDQPYGSSMIKYFDLIRKSFFFIIIIHWNNLLSIYCEPKTMTDAVGAVNIIWCEPTSYALISPGL